MSKADMEFVRRHLPNAELDVNEKRRCSDRFQILVPCWPENGHAIYGNGVTQNAAWKSARKEVEIDLNFQARIDAVRMPLDRWFDYAEPIRCTENLEARRGFFAGIEASLRFYDESEQLGLFKEHDLLRRWIIDLKLENERQNGRPIN